MKTLKIKRNGQIITSVLLYGKELSSTEVDNHFAVTSDMVSGIIIRDLPHDLHLTVVHEINQGIVTISYPLSYCVHNNNHNKAELHYVFQLSTDKENDIVMLMDFVDAIRDNVRKLSKTAHIFDVSKCKESGGWVNFTFKQIVDGSTLDDVIQTSNVLQENIDQIMNDLGENLDVESI
jgi:hypothetical protein